MTLSQLTRAEDRFAYAGEAEQDHEELAWPQLSLGASTSSRVSIEYLDGNIGKQTAPYWDQGGVIEAPASVR